MMDTKLPEARLPQEFILDAFADPSSVRDVVRGKPLLLKPFSILQQSPAQYTDLRSLDSISELEQGTSGIAWERHSPPQPHH